LALFALLLTGGICFAQNVSEYNRIDQLLKGGLKNSNLAAIQEGAANLDEVERLRLYNNHKLLDDSMWLGVALDFFVGWGIGNFVQRDYLGGGITLGGHVAGLACMIVGLVKVYSTLDNAAYGSSTSITDVYYEFLGFYIAGGVISLGSQIFGLVRAFTFPSSYNNKLKKALQVQGLVMNIEPSINITGQGLELALVNLKF
jgi:hypothetical protein